MTYKLAIVDDDAKQRAYLTEIVNTWAKKNRHLLTLKQYAKANPFLFDYAEEKNFDILLLDIEMPGISGIELAKTVRCENATVQIIFITGFPDFIAEGYEVSALHYLMKPVSPDKLSNVLDKAVSNLAKSEKTLCVTHDRSTDFLPLSRILYIEAQKQYVLIHTDKETYRMKATLAETEKQLDEFFYKCQRSYLVNLRHVARIKSDCVVLKTGAEVPISRGMAEAIGKEIIRLF